MEQAIYGFSRFCARKYNSLFFQYIGKKEPLALRRGRVLCSVGVRFGRALKREGPCGGWPSRAGRSRGSWPRLLRCGTREGGEGGRFPQARRPPRRAGRSAAREAAKNPIPREAGSRGGCRGRPAAQGGNAAAGRGPSPGFGRAREEARPGRWADRRRAPGIRRCAGRARWSPWGNSPCAPDR